MARLKFYISTHASTGRPIITLSCDIFELKCLIDTGADTPVWFGDMESFKSYFPSATYVKDVSIGGFGGSKYYQLWCVSKFVVSDSVNNFCIENLYIAICPSDTKSFKLLLSITCFSRMSVHFEMKSGRLYIDYARDSYKGYIARDINGNEHFQVLLEDDDVAADYAAATQKMLRDNGLKGN